MYNQIYEKIGVSMKVYLCSICNISSGRCLEDCKFCTQSVHYKTDIDRYYRKNISTILDEAKVAESHGSVGFCLVTATKELDDKTLDFVTKCAYEIKKELPDLGLIGCNGLADKDSLNELQKAGIENYNHNLESSREFYPTLCTTHSWEDRVTTCQNVKDIGMQLCCGGIFGMGESPDDRISLLQSLKDLDPISAPINFYHPNEMLPLTSNTIQKKEALELIKLSRKYLPNAMIMVAGGREIVFEDDLDSIFDNGANSIVIGDYLTTKGKSPKQEIEKIKSMGHILAKSCHE
jgi:biotin synthase